MKNRYLCRIEYQNKLTEGLIMARPIKETPVVTGKDAENFATKLANLKSESEEEKKAAEEAYRKFKAIATFAL